MKILLLSASIMILGYFALQALPERGHTPHFASTSSDVTGDVSPYARKAPRVGGRR